MFTKVIIANRGEIAVRVVRACRELGIATVVVYTEADRSWLPYALADEAVLIGSGPAADSYINVDKIIDAAKSTGADAIHPGYGFLAENAEFAKRCVEEGLVFIGPSAEAIKLMGNKARAKQFVAGLGIPVIEGFEVNSFDFTELREAAAALGYPVMLKAAAGGGGVGIRIVETDGQLEDALASARREARSAFGDESILLEKYFPRVRHIEVQVVADQFGNALHCYERECSAQRRHQKVIEEAPSPFVSDELRQRLCDASLSIVAAADYVGVGTVEFIVVDNRTSNGLKTAEDDFYFLEMNTRLQVEHGVTEAVTGLDLVRMQIALAEGQSLEHDQSDICLNGHAIECRLCAEDPARDFLPDAGKIVAWGPPSVEGVRVDTGVKDGAAVTVFYDSLVAKLISKAASREGAVRLMLQSLKQTVLFGVRSNQHFLISLVRDPGFVAGEVDTTFIERELPRLTKTLDRCWLDEVLVVSAIRCARDEIRHLGTGQGGAFVRSYQLEYDGDTESIELAWADATACTVRVGKRVYDVESGHAEFQDGGLEMLRVSFDRIDRRYLTARSGRNVFAHVPGRGSFFLIEPSAHRHFEESEETGQYNAPMAGVVVSVLVNTGEQVCATDPLVVIESMKMEHRICAFCDGVVAAVGVEAGQTVQVGDFLVAAPPNNSGDLGEENAIDEA